MNTNSRRIRPSAVSVALALVLLGLAVWPNSPNGIAASLTAPEIWRIAPPAPKIAETERLSELRARRQEVMKRMGGKSLMVLFGAEPRVYTNDVDYMFRQENNLYYLTGIKQEGASLILIPGASRTREILFMPERNPGRETWTGHMMSVEEARARSGVQEVWDSRLLNGFLAFLAPRAEQTLA